MEEIVFENNADAISLHRQLQLKLNHLPPKERQMMAKYFTSAARKSMVAFSESMLLRALQSQNEQIEALVWFWFNHFNVFWNKGLVSVALPDYVDNAIRPHVLGQFKDLLFNTLTHPAMLVYLDNASNIANKINENYARELLELHTLGVNGGYTQQDVKEVARILTGVRLKPMKPKKYGPNKIHLVREKGEFMFDPVKHDMKDKAVLGHTIKGSGFDEVETLLDILVRHPSTAKFIAQKLCVYLLGDNPPDATISHAAKAFADSNGNIAKTVDVIQAHKTSVNKSTRTFKDPYRFVISAVRLLSGDAPLKHAKPLIRWLNELGEPLFGRSTPDGYSLYGKDWISSGQLIQRFDIAKEMVTVIPRLTQTRIKPEAILERPSTKALVSSLGERSRSSLAKSTDADDKLALLISSPEFMYW